MPANHDTDEATPGRTDETKRHGGEATAPSLTVGLEAVRKKPRPLGITGGERDSVADRSAGSGSQ